MKFIVNKKHWKIKEVSEDWLIQDYKKDHPNSEIGYLFGVCKYTNQTIYLSNEIHNEQKIDTLKHELTHCWLFNHGLSNGEYTEERVCDIVSAINDFIHEIVDKYRKK